MRPLALILSFALATAPLAPQDAWAQAFDAPTDRVVMLKDGTVLRGPIVEEVPGDHVVIVVQGLRTRVRWKDMVHEEERPREKSRPSALSNVAIVIFGGAGFFAVLGGLGMLKQASSSAGNQADNQRIAGFMLAGGVVSMLVALGIALGQSGGGK